MLYLYGFSVRAGTEGLRYSYTATISQEDIGAGPGRHRHRAVPGPGHRGAVAQQLERPARA